MSVHSAQKSALPPADSPRRNVNTHTQRRFIEAHTKVGLPAADIRRLME